MNQNSSLEKKVFSISGWGTLIAFFVVLIYFGREIYNHIADDSIAEIDWWLVIKNVVVGLIIPAIVFLGGNKSLQRNEAVVYTFMGTYMGTLRGDGYFWVPFWYGEYSDRDLALIPIEVETIKVNDKKGSPILIGGIIYCREKDTHRATFDISNLGGYLATKGDVSLRSVAMSHPYDASGDAVSLKGDTEVVLKEFKEKVSADYELAGYEVESVAITTLNYASEIASSMLQKQQAEATVEARETIAKGVVGIVKATIENLESESKITFKNSAKQRLATSLMTVLCSAQPVTPVISVSEISPASTVSRSGGNSNDEDDDEDDE